MSLNRVIKRILKEETQEWIELDPEEYLDLLKYVNGDGSLIKRLPDYRDKKIKIVGNLTIDDINVKNIDKSIDYVDGDLDISSSGVEFFDKSKVKGGFRYWFSEMARIEKRKELEKKYNELDELRNKDAWNINNGDITSYQTEALFQHLKSSGIANEEEDKYFIYPYYNHGFSEYFLWLGEDLFESEWLVVREDKIYDEAYDS